MNVYIHLEILENFNLFKHFLCKNSKSSTNGCLKIFVALKSEEFACESIY